MSIVIKIVCALLSFAFIMAGSGKLTPALVGDEMHQELSGKFVTYAKAYDTAKFDITAEQFRHLIGLIEIVAVVLLWLSPRLGSFLLVAVMLGAIYTHFLVEDQPADAIPAAVLLALSLIVFIGSGAPAKAKGTRKTQ